LCDMAFLMRPRRPFVITGKAWVAGTRYSFTTEMSGASSFFMPTTW